MKMICTVTGLEYTLGKFMKNSGYQVTCLHPLLTMPMRQLNSISHNAGTNVVTDSDNIMLFAAYLHKTGLVKFSAPLPITDLPLAMATRYFELVFSIANGHQEGKQLPLFNHTGNMKALRDYLELLKVTIESGYNRPVLSDNESLTDISEDLLLEMQDRIKYHRQLGAAKRAKAKNLSHIKEQALLSLGIATGITQDNLEIISRVFNKPEQFPIAAFKKVKHLCLDHLPESTFNDSVKKDTIIQWLDTQLVNRLQVSIALEDNAELLAEYNAELTSLANTYTVIATDKDGEATTKVNSAVPVAKQISELLGKESTKPTQELAPEINTPVAYPTPNDYPNKMAYTVALRKWHTSNSGL